MMKRDCVHRNVLRVVGTALAVVLIGGSGKKLESQIPTLPLQGPTQPTTASRQPVPLPPSNPRQSAQLTAEDVTAFLDGFLPLQLQRDDIAGATVGITMNGQPLILKG